MNNFLLVLTGKTASGKDTVMLFLLSKFPNLKRVLTTTSRPPRQGEKEGADYHFINPQEFKEKINKGDFIEFVEYGGNFYGTEKTEFDNSNKDLIWRIDPSMAGKVKELFKNSLVIYLTVDDNVVLERLKGRGIGEKEIQKRMSQDKEFFNQYRQNYDFVVENTPGKLKETVQKVIQIIQDATAQKN